PAEHDQHADEEQRRCRQGHAEREAQGDHEAANEAPADDAPAERFVLPTERFVLPLILSDLRTERLARVDRGLVVIAVRGSHGTIAAPPQTGLQSALTVTGDLLALDGRRTRANGRTPRPLADNPGADWRARFDGSVRVAMMRARATAGGLPRTIAW